MFFGGGYFRQVGCSFVSGSENVGLVNELDVRSRIDCNQHQATAYITFMHNVHVFQGQFVFKIFTKSLGPRVLTRELTYGSRDKLVFLERTMQTELTCPFLVTRLLTEDLL